MPSSISHPSTLQMHLMTELSWTEMDRRVYQRDRTKRPSKTT
jgi:hypothetical protein